MDITDHALERFREKHPEADRPMVESFYSWGFEINPEVAGLLTQSQRRAAAKGSRYTLAPDYSGVFVQVNGSIVTFLRFGAFQRQVCEGMWGELSTEKKVVEREFSVTISPPPSKKPKNPDSVRAFRIWVGEHLGINEMVCFPPEMPVERKRELVRHMRTTPCTNPNAYEWVWEEATLMRSRSKYLVVENER